jgi:hypothetical protein
MGTVPVTRHVSDQDVFQTARALHARFHAVPWSLVTDVLALGVSEHVTTLSNASLLNCVSGGILSLHMHPCSSLIVGSSGTLADACRLVCSSFVPNRILCSDGYSQCRSFDYRV